jgi:hypothetical protein
MTWVAPRAVLDRSKAPWATCRLALSMTVPVVVPHPGTPVIVPPAGAGGATMPPPKAGGGGGLGGPPYEARETKVFSPSSMSVFAWRVG